MVQGRSPCEPKSGEEVKPSDIHLGRSLGQVVEKMRVDGEARSQNQL